MATEALTEEGLNLEQSISIQQFKNYLKSKTTERVIKQTFKDKSCFEMAVDFLTTQATDDVIAFDFWYAHWSGKWAKKIKDPKAKWWAHYGLKKYVLKRYYDARNNKK